VVASFKFTGAAKTNPVNIVTITKAKIILFKKYLFIKSISFLN